MEIIEMLLTPNQYSRPKIPLSKVLKIAVHYVGNPGSTAVSNRNYFESLKDKKCVYASSHYIIGLEGEIIRCIPEYEIAYCTNNANSYSLSIENCHPCADGKFNSETYNKLVELCADICIRYNLNPLEDIIRHYDVTGKKCPLYFVEYPKEFKKFKEDVKVSIEGNPEIKNVGEAISKLAKIGVISSPDYWNSAVKCINFLDILLINSAKKCKDYKTGNNIVEEGVGILYEKGIINTPAYWTNAIRVVKYLDSLILNIANRL